MILIAYNQFNEDNLHYSNYNINYDNISGV